MYTDSEFDRILAENPAWQELLVCAKSQSVAQFKALLVRLISEIDTSISEQLSDVIQHPNYKQLEASWTGLKSLAQLQVSQRRVKIKMLDLSWSMVSADLNYSFDLKQSSLYRKLYSNELDTAGGSPFGMVMVDHKVSADYADDQEYDDLYTLQLLSELGELSFAQWCSEPTSFSLVMNREGCFTTVRELIAFLLVEILFHGSCYEKKAHHDFCIW